MIIQVNNGQRGPLQVTPVPAAAGEQRTDKQQLAAGTTTPIAGGAYLVEIYNTGLYDITVNGKVVTPGDHVDFKKQYNAATQTEDFTPALTVVVPADGAAYYFESRPS